MKENDLFGTTITHVHTRCYLNEYLGVNLPLLRSLILALDNLPLPTHVLTAPKPSLRHLTYTMLKWIGYR